MRKFLISLMAATMLVPAAAQAEDSGFVRGMREHAARSSNRDNDNDTRASRSQSSQREDRSNDRPARSERAPRADRPARVERVERAQQIEGAGVAARDVRRVERVRRTDREVQQIEQVRAAEPVQRTQQVQRRRDGLVDGFTRIARDGDGSRTRNRDNDRDWRRDRDGRRHDWSRDWRRDGRYNWSSHRNRYGSLFRLGRYYDPYGYRYRRFSIGFNLWPSYYGSNYWLNDPWMYRLPPAYGPYRWVRYYDDALLVNIYSGQVVDVIHNFFW